tara:strand:- start:57 stop:467 length:411 start_codon:yes stop_codon:yes gene_type:complete
MAAPNIVNVSTITGITTRIAGISTIILEGGGGGGGISTMVTNAASSGKVLKINSLVATAIGDTTGVSVFLYDTASAHGGAGNTVSLASTMTVPLYSSLAVIDKSNSIYLEENTQIGVQAQSNAGSIDVVVSYEDIS